jgi:hypothetical protein
LEGENELKKFLADDSTVNIVIDDEIEFFKSYDDPEFNYPYITRTSRINPFVIIPNLGFNE